MLQESNKYIAENEVCPDLDVLTSYQNKELGETESLRVQNHINSCEFCQEVALALPEVNLAEVDQIVKSVSGKLGVATSPINGTAQYQWYKIAASVALLVVFTLTIFLIIDSNGSESKELTSSYTPRNTANLLTERASSEEVIIQKEIPESEISPDPVENVAEPSIDLEVIAEANAIDENQEDGTEALIEEVVTNSDPVIEETPVLADVEKKEDIPSQPTLASVNILNRYNPTESNGGIRKLGRAKSNNSPSFGTLNSNLYDAEASATFPGGDHALKQHFSNYFADASKNTGINTAIISFEVKPNGKVTHTEVEKGIDKEITKRLNRMMKDMPQWQKASSDGGTNVVYRISINVPHSELSSPDGVKAEY